MIQANGAQIIVRMLERQGIETIAGIPGGSVLPLYDELSKSSIRHILVRHEQAAGFIAQGIARTTGKPAACIATSGPGATNLITALADARSDSIPLVAITGQVNTALLGTDAFQEVDMFSLSFPITKHSFMIKNTKELLTVIPRAFEIASSGRPGPVLIDIPRDIQQNIIEFDAWPEPGQYKIKAEGKFRSSQDEFARNLYEAAQTLYMAQKPVVYAGGGCNSIEVSKSLLSFLERLPMPVVTSLMGIGTISTKNPLFMGFVGMHGSIAANMAMHNSDVVLAIGVRFDDRATGLIKEFCPNARIIHIDIDAAEINKILPASISVVADAQSAIPFLNSCFYELGTQKSEIKEAQKQWLQSIQEIKKKFNKTDPQLEIGRPGNSIQQLPRIAKTFGTIDYPMSVVTDVGQHQMWTAQYYPFESTRQFITSGSLGTMGFGLPTAIGVALANPEKRVICITGDGSLMMNIQELATLSELDLNITIFVLDNGALGMVRQQQDCLFNTNRSASVFEQKIDIVAIAKGFGIIALDNSDQGWEDFAFSGTGPRFIRYSIAIDESVYPFVPAGKANIHALQDPRTSENTSSEISAEHTKAHAESLAY